ncbi:MAG: hypothetical protein B7Y08_18480 [Rhodospirillales bacterium 24-66-33]|nr:MAG: hypothetical protein B7Y57_17230 [Rhodospirillales bacterium 35-66-84]OYZ93069.1 MAG: hypothetical protein B7Y08_18480 [Rhodospirillales bacterium 24-66-33]OZB24197.1 MAG: hypothetical protein B7X63_16440 [Rhodospirillales bacterium 39-66-50]
MHGAPDGDNDQPSLISTTGPAMDLARLSLEVNSDSVRQATVALREMVPAASAAERAAQRWGTSNSAAARATEDFSKRVQRTIRDLEFERQQLTRTAAERERYAVLRRAGVAEMSAEGRAIASSVAALQAQRAASANAAMSMKGVGAAGTAAAGSVALLTRALGPLSVLLLAAAAARKVFTAGLNAGNLGEEAEQVGLNTDQLQAYRLAGAQAGIQAEQFDAALTKLTRTVGAANDGSKEQIDLFERLGVKLLDNEGGLRKTADLMPEIARGLLKVGSETERNAMLQDLFGRSGMKMVTVLGLLAEGNEKLVDTAKQQNAIIGEKTMAAWDSLGDRMAVASQQADTLFATLGRPVALAGLEMINFHLGNMFALMKGIEKTWSYITSGPSVGTLETRAKTLQATIDAMTSGAAGEMDDLGKARLAGLYRQLGEVQQQIGDQQTAAYMPPVTVTASPIGVRNPTAKGGSAGSDPYAKAVEGAREYVLTKQAETAAIGLSTEAAARLKHEQDLLNKVMGDGKSVTDAQRAALSELAASMAAADAGLEAAKYENERRSRVDDFLANQEMERQSIFMTAEAAARLRYETEMLAEAKRRLGDVSPQMRENISADAEQMARSEEQTRRLREGMQFARDLTKGLFMEFAQGIREGQSIWEAFGNAGLSALSKIADKLIEMAANQLMAAAFGGGGGMGGMGGGGGGLLGGALSFIGGLLFENGAAIHRGNVVPFAHGAAFDHGHLTRFAAGGIATEPTYFGMSGGRTGVMGEAGPEAIMPLTRMPDGKLGVQAHGGPGRVEPMQRGGGGSGGRSSGGGDGPITVNVENRVTVGEFVSRAEVNQAMRQVALQTKQSTIAAIVDMRKRGGLKDVFNQ